MTPEEKRRILAPILIGVTGHTRIREEDLPRLQAAVESILLDLRRQFPSTPLILVSSLAEGSDQLCAGAALNLGLEVISPLPFPPELYETRFKSPAARETLRRLTAKSSPIKWFVPAERGKPSIDFPNCLGDDNRRKQRYADVGNYVACHCHALIAFWDDADETSVTGQLVQAKSRGVLPRNASAGGEAPDPGVVYRVFAPRPEWRPVEGKQPGEVSIMPGADAGGARLFGDTCRLTEALNCRIAVMPAPTRNDLATPPVPCTKIEGDLAAFRRLVANESYRAKRHVSRFTVVIFLLVLAGAGLFHAYSHLHELWPTHATAALTAALALLITAVIVPRFVRHVENRALDYRALAEALRVQFHWHNAGLREWVPDHYLRRQRSELLWIREATRAWALRLEAEASTATLDAGRAAAVSAGWFGGQQRFYASSHHQNHRSHVIWRWAYRIFGSGAGLMALALLIGVVSGVVHEPPPVYLFVITLALLAGALALAYGEKQLFAEHARHFHAMDLLFQDRLREAQAEIAAGRVGRVEKILREVGEECLGENTEWLVLHRIRPFEMPPFG